MNKLENYETVKERKKRFYSDHPDGSLLSELVFHEKGHVIMKGLVYKTKEDQKNNVPTGVGHAEEYQGQGGFANKFSWMENCCESSIGRALDNAGYSGNNKCSREEMEKVERNESLPHAKYSNELSKEERAKVERYENQKNDEIEKEKLRKKLDALPEEIQEYFKIMQFEYAQKFEFCRENDWDLLKMKTTIRGTGCEKFEDAQKFEL